MISTPTRWHCFLIAVLFLGHFSTTTEAQGRRRPPAVFDSGDQSECVIKMEGSSGGRQQPYAITASVVCGRESLFDETLSVDEIEATRLPNGIRLFSSTPFGGMAYVYIDRSLEIDLVDSSFTNLRKIGDNEMAAIMVIRNDAIDITDTNFTNNGGDFRSGAMIVGGTATVELQTVIFTNNVGEEGTVHVTDTAHVDFDFCTFRGNNGTEVGGVKLSSFCTAAIKEALFRSDHGLSMSNEIYVTDESTLLIASSHMEGDDAMADFEAFITDGSRPDNEADAFNLPFGGHIAVARRSQINVVDCLLKGHVGRFGSIYAVDAPVFTVSRTDFVDNRAVIGGGLYVNADRTGFARTLRCNFTGNVARYGGALVFAGNGTYGLDNCQFENNKAINGGAIWGDYSEQNTCPRASAGSRITIANCKFANNTAQRNGGGFFIQCTDIYAENCTFEENVAANGDGGFIYAGNTFDMRFKNCSLSRNRASGSGGAIYVDRSNDIVTDNCTVVKNTAGRDGGTIVSLNGHGIMFANSTLINSTAGRHGGAIFASNLERVLFENTPIQQINAKRRGGVFTGSNVGRFTWRDLTATINSAAQSGVVHINGGSRFALTNVQIIDNEALSEHAGAIELISVSNIDLSNVTILRNLASKQCGAISITNASDIAVERALFELNSGTFGGAMCINGTDVVKFSDVVLQSNEATEGTGGAIFAPNANRGMFRNVTVEMNTAMKSGSIHFENGEKFDIKNMSVSDNQASVEDGGGISLLNIKSVDISSLNMSRNSALKSCGALRIRGGNRFEIRNSNFKFNAGASGGAICIAEMSRSELSSVEFRSNEATEGDGGAVEVVGGEDLLMTRVGFYLNEAQGSGGGFSMTGLSSAEIVKTTVENATSSDSGGCFVSRDVLDLTLSDSLFANCTAVTGGGAIFKGRSKINKRSVTFQHNAAERSGGAFHCSQITTITVKDSVYFFNHAPDGSTFEADCNCKVDVSHSTIRREHTRKNNGDFFKIKRGCAELQSFNNLFFGAPEKNSADLEWYEWFMVAIGIFFIFTITLCLCRRRRKRKEKAKNISKHPIDKANDLSEEEEDEEEEDDEDEYEETEDEDDEDDDVDEDEEDDVEEEAAGENKKERRRHHRRRSS